MMAEMGEGPLAEQLLAEFSAMPSQLQAAARYVLERPKEVALLTMRKQAQRAGVSHSTMARLAVWLGLDGYEELRALYARAVLAADDDSHTDEGANLVRDRSDMITVDLVAAMFARQAASLALSVEIQQLKAMADLLRPCRRLFCLGLGVADPVATNFAQLLARFDREVVVPDITHQADIDLLRRGGHGDAMLAIGFAPYDTSVIGPLREAARRGLVMVAVTDASNSPLVSLSRKHVIVPTQSPSVFQSIVAAVSVTETLATCLVQQDQAGGQHMGEEGPPPCWSGHARRRNNEEPGHGQ